MESLNSIANRRWPPKLQRPWLHSLLPWEDSAVALPTPLARCLQGLLPRKPAMPATRPLTHISASTATATVGCVHSTSVDLRRWVLLVRELILLCFIPDGSRSGQFPSRAAEAVWPQWQGQQHSQSNAEQRPHGQGNQQDIFPVSESSHIYIYMHYILPLCHLK